MINHDKPINSYKPHRLSFQYNTEGLVSGWKGQSMLEEPPNCQNVQGWKPRSSTWSLSFSEQSHLCLFRSFVALCSPDSPDLRTITGDRMGQVQSFRKIWQHKHGMINYVETICGTCIWRNMINVESENLIPWLAKSGTHGSQTSMIQAFIICVEPHRYGPCTQAQLA